jgi:putative hemolysin
MLVELPIEKARALTEVNRLYTLSSACSAQMGSFCSAGLETLDVEYDLCEGDLAEIPRGGPVVVVANRPSGAAEGLMLGAILTRVRGDARILGNPRLQEVPQMRPWIIPVDVRGGAEAARARTNLAALRASLRWLKAGGVLAIFPAGAVSPPRGAREGVTAPRAADPPWPPHVAALARRTGATVVPVFFEGEDRDLRRVAGLLHGRPRTALPPSELLGLRRGKVLVRIGRPVGPDEMARYPDDATLADHLRLETQALDRRPR